MTNCFHLKFKNTNIKAHIFSLDNAVFPCDIFNIYVQREQSGLGLSIAGGKESTPYKGDDEVTFIFCGYS